MSFENVEDSSSEVNESQEIDETGSEVTEDEDGPEYSLEENMDKLDDEGTEVNETDESGDNASEGEANAEYSLEDNMDKLDEDEASDLNSEQSSEVRNQILATSLDRKDGVETDTDENVSEDEGLVLPGVEQQETGIDIQEDKEPKGASDGGSPPEPPDDDRRNGAIIEGSGDVSEEPKSEREKFLDSLRVDISDEVASNEADLKTNSADVGVSLESANDNSPDGSNIEDSVDASNGSKTEHEKFLDSLRVDVSEQNTSSETGTEASDADDDNDEPHEPPERDISTEIPIADDDIER